MRDLVFLLDVDNTLLDNDGLKDDLAAAVEELVEERGERFWELYESVRRGEQYVDFPTTLELFEEEFPDAPNDELKRLVMGVDFRLYHYPEALQTVEYLKELGTVIILSDGDPVFQRMKIERSGLHEAVGGRVLLTVHKQDEMERVFSQFPGDHYVLIDDKTSILADIKEQYGAKVTTVLVRQGKYSRVATAVDPDITVEAIAQIRALSRDAFLSLAGPDPIRG